MQKVDVVRLHDALSAHEVEYMIIGKGAAIMQGYSSTTQDIDIYPSKSLDNRDRLLAALNDLGFQFDIMADSGLQYPSSEILDAKDFIQLKGPFELDIVFAPDGFESYEEALSTKTEIDGFPVMNIDGIIKTKTAAGRKKDMNDIDDLKLFRQWLRKQETQDAKE